MLIVTVTTDCGPAQLLGAIECLAIAPIADYRWHSSLARDGVVQASLDNYSRWAEPAAALMARLLARRPVDAPRLPPASEVTCELFIGQSVAAKRPIERVTARIDGSILCASHSDEQAGQTDFGARRAEYSSLEDLLIHAVRLSLWGDDEEPEVPPPLTTVPIRSIDGVSVVLVADIPAYPRRQFVRRRDGCTVPFPNAFFAHDWFDFIGGRP